MIGVLLAGSRLAAAPCRVPGKEVSLPSVVVVGTPALSVSVFHQPVTLELPEERVGEEAQARAIVDGQLAFEGTVSLAEARFFLGRPQSLWQGRLMLARGLELVGLKREGGKWSAQPGADAPLRFDGLAVPCEALLLDGADAVMGETPASAFVDKRADAKGDGTFWIPLDPTVKLRLKPDEKAPPLVATIVDMESLPVFEGIARRGAWIEVYLREGGVMVRGWVLEREMHSTPGGYGRGVGGLAGVRARLPPMWDARRDYQGPASIAKDAPVLDRNGRRWATLRDDREVQVRWAPTDDEVRLVALPGASFSPLDGRVDRSLVQLPLAPDSWRFTGAPLFNRSDHSVTALADGGVLVVGGWDLTDERPRAASSVAGAADAAEGGARPPLALAERWDPRAEAERFRPAGVSAARAGHSATVLADGRVLIVGGERETSAQGIALDSAFLYEPATNTWSPTGTLDTARSGHTASLLTDGTVLVVGGDDGHGHALKSCERWDPRTGKWSAAAHLLARRHGHAATLLADGTLLVTAGRHKNYAMKQFWETPAIDVTERYDPVADTWTRGANMPGGGRFRHGAVLLADGRVFVAGGFVGIDAEADPALLRAALLYRPVDDTWAIAPPPPVPLEGFRIVRLADGRVLAASATESVTYDGATGEWSTPAALHRSRYAALLVALPDGRALLAGGRPESNDEADAALRPGAELYAPPRRSRRATAAPLPAAVAPSSAPAPTATP